MLRALLKNHATEWVVARDVIISTELLELDCVSNFTRVNYQGQDVSRVHKVKEMSSIWADQ
jgi:hypothetical protein